LNKTNKLTILKLLQIGPMIFRRTTNTNTKKEVRITKRSFNTSIGVLSMENLVKRIA
jgi:hypothetical protein